MTNLDPRPIRSMPAPGLVLTIPLWFVAGVVLALLPWLLLSLFASPVGDDFCFGAYWQNGWDELLISAQAEGLAAPTATALAVLPWALLRATQLDVHFLYVALLLLGLVICLGGLRWLLSLLLPHMAKERGLWFLSLAALVSFCASLPQEASALLQWPQMVAVVWPLLALLLIAALFFDMLLRGAQSASASAFLLACFLFAVSAHVVVPVLVSLLFAAQMIVRRRVWHLWRADYRWLLLAVSVLGLVYHALLGGLVLAGPDARDALGALLLALNDWQNMFVGLLLAPQLWAWLLLLLALPLTVPAPHHSLTYWVFLLLLALLPIVPLFELYRDGYQLGIEQMHVVAAGFLWLAATMLMLRLRALLRAMVAQRLPWCSDKIVLVLALLLFLVGPTSLPLLQDLPLAQQWRTAQRERLALLLENPEPQIFLPRIQAHPPLLAADDLFGSPATRQRQCLADLFGRDVVLPATTER